MSISTTTASTNELKILLNNYYKIFPLYTFPYIPFIIAAFFQSIAWMSGPIFLSNYTLFPRILILILFAIGEYIFMIPTMNAGIEILGFQEPNLVITYNIILLFVFIFVNIVIFKKGFNKKYMISFLFGGLSIYFANKANF